MQLIFIVIKSWDDIVTPGIVVKYVQLSIRSFGDKIAQITYRVVACEFEREESNIGVGRSVLGGIAYGRKNLET